MTVGFAALAVGVAIGLAAFVWWLHRDADAGPIVAVPSLALWGEGASAVRRRPGLWWLVRAALVLVLLAAALNIDIPRIGARAPQVAPDAAPGPEVLRVSARRSLTEESGLSLLITVSPEAQTADLVLVVRDGDRILGQMELSETSLLPLRLDIPMPGGAGLTVTLEGPSGAVSQLDVPVMALVTRRKVAVAESCGAGMARALRASGWHEPVASEATLMIDCAPAPRPDAELRIWTGGQTPVQAGWTWNGPLAYQKLPELTGLKRVTRTGNDVLKADPIWRAGSQILAGGQSGAVDVFVDLSRPETQADARFAMLFLRLIDLAAGASPSRQVIAEAPLRPTKALAVPDQMDPRDWLIGLALLLLFADGMRGLRRGV